MLYVYSICIVTVAFLLGWIVCWVMEFDRRNAQREWWYKQKGML